MGTRIEKPVVLIVDDNEGIRSFGRTFFSDLNYRVVTATNYEGAMRSIRKIVVDDMNDHIVALIDVNLGGGPSGLKLLRDIKDQYTYQVIPYILTGNESIVLEGEAKAAGAFEIFRKTGKAEDWDRLAIAADPTRSPVLRLIAHLAEDELTGLDNFGQFRRRALALLMVAKKRGNPEALSLISVDVDFFKVINDTHGHPVGDQVLKKIAEVMNSHVRLTDILCRKSGDEFLILLPETAEAASVRGEELRRAVADSYVTNQYGFLQVKFSISFGVAEVRHDKIEDPNKTLDQIISLADTGKSGLYPKRRTERE